MLRGIPPQLPPQNLLPPADIRMSEKNLSRPNGRLQFPFQKTMLKINASAENKGSKHTVQGSPGGRLSPVIDAEFIENMNDVTFYRVFGDIQFL